LMFSLALVLARSPDMEDGAEPVLLNAAA